MKPEEMAEMDKMMQEPQGDPDYTPAPPTTEMQPKGMMETEVCIPLKALAQPDDGDVMQTPAEGDSVNFTTDGVITRVEGENAYVKATAINGTPIGKEAMTDTPEGEMVDDGMALRQEAEGM